MNNQPANTPLTYSANDAHTTAVNDAISEVELDGPIDFAAALRWIPSEYHSRARVARDRFVASVITNARAVKRSPYTVALFALDSA